MNVAAPYQTEDGSKRLQFYCPGCKSHHFVIVKAKHQPVWKWNGSHSKPTFRPSVKVTYALKPKPKLCHFFIRNGKIQYLNDCFHGLKGQTINMVEV